MDLANKAANAFFKDIDFTSIVDTIKNIYMSDGAMNTLLDFERVLDEADVYAFRNWINGELVNCDKLKINEWNEEKMIKKYNIKSYQIIYKGIKKHD